jgi:outer membrane protein assembly factor BamB
VATHAAPTPQRRRRTLGILVVVALAALATAYLVADDDEGGGTEVADAGEPPADAAAGESTTTGTTEPEEAPPASGFAREGLLTFRGNPTRTYYGEGPVPTAPRVLWSYPGASGGMCAESAVANETRVWCGSGWTGQPSVFEHEGRTWVVFGAYDRAIHFVDWETGEDLRPPFPTGDIIKGSVTIDPDGYPIVYSGSRDDEYHIVAFDRPEPTELWSLAADAVSPTMWNNDWDGSALVIDDYLIEGGENSQFHVVKLNRGYDADGLVTVDPQLVFNTPGWDQQLLDDIGDRDVSIENSVAIHDGIAYFTNGGGLVQGWDLNGLEAGVVPTQVFRFWTGDDTDASIVIDDEGFLYVASEYERANARSAEVGQLLKLDPRNPADPIVWSVADRDHLPGGFWATPALHDGVVIVPDDAGFVRGWDQGTGEQLWEFRLTGPTWQSPVVVDDVLIQGDCDGVLHGYDVSDPRVLPPELWQVSIGGCIESTPAVWRGRLFFGTRAGRFWAVGDA